jgi:3D (Asp-Asp-Asp) domain-containing protein
MSKINKIKLIPFWAGLGVCVYTLLLFFASCSGSFIGEMYGNWRYRLYMLPDFKVTEQTKYEYIELKPIFREVTAYTSRVIETDNEPCLSASGDNICELYAKGKQICATNAYPLHTKLYIKGFGECEVLDKMNKRFTQRVDIYFGMDLARALKFGLQTLEVSKI